MNFPVLANSEPRTISLTFSQYADFVWHFLEHANYERLCEQKAREEIIATPFSLNVNGQGTKLGAKAKSKERLTTDYTDCTDEAGSV